MQDYQGAEGYDNIVSPGSNTTPDDGHNGVVYESPMNGRGGIVV